ncbi:hypothetical protein [Vannielia sp.]|uniref:hypothetical protein n=1 Tax=Vannielia sp. TaxID=2813045 RepID=UPI002601F766|nr:hypothetical protein [Vannielia sp.]MDF1871988.1 hypothetical protein [Vannielia sp.]
MSEQPKEQNRPIDKHRDGAIEVAIWRRETEKGFVFNTERTRSYLDQDGNWQKTNVIPERDLLKAARLDEKAYETIQNLRERERDEAQTRSPSRKRQRSQDYDR